jgi:two-component system, response regulator YesN
MYKVLVVDDERIIREGIATIIDWAKHGFLFAGTASNGIEAYEMILRDPPHIVITDIKMPGINGLELISKAKEKFSEMVFVILSGYGEFDLAKEAMYYGVRHYLLKPCNENKIVEVLIEIKNELLQREDKEGFIKQNIEQGENKSRHEDLIFDYDSLGMAVKSGNIDVVGVEIDNYFRELQLKKYETNIIKLYAMQLFMVIIRHCSVEEIDKYTHEITELQNLKSFEQIQEFVKTAGIDVSNVNHVNTVITHSKLVRTIIQHVQENLGDEDLSLKWLSNHVLYMSDGYVSKIFFKEIGEKFSHYLMRARMEKAKELIRKSDDDLVCEVAQKVGFGNNPQYFSQLFKKYTGWSPSDYKKRELK